MNEELIVSDPEIMVGKPTIKGTRITVQLILEHMASGDSVEDLLEDYPFLTREQVSAALLYSAAVLRQQPLSHAS